MHGALSHYLEGVSVEGILVLKIRHISLCILTSHVAFSVVVQQAAWCRTCNCRMEFLIRATQQNGPILPVVACEVVPSGGSVGLRAVLHHVLENSLRAESLCIGLTSLRSLVNKALPNEGKRN